MHPITVHTKHHRHSQCTIASLKQQPDLLLVCGVFICGSFATTAITTITHEVCMYSVSVYAAAHLVALVHLVAMQLVHEARVCMQLHACAYPNAHTEYMHSFFLLTL